MISHGAAAGPARQLNADEVGDWLRRRGLRATGPRLLVYRTLAEQRGHHSADEIAGAIAGSGPGLPRTSVYNALRTLVDAGLVRVVDAGPGTTLYEVHGPDHHHFLCRICLRLTDVAAGMSVEHIAQAPGPGAVIESAQVLLRGVCGSCAAEDRRAEDLRGFDDQATGDQAGDQAAGEPGPGPGRQARGQARTGS